jgi:ribosome-binding factor A
MGRRLLKVNEAVREVLSGAIAEGLKDPRIGFVTVTSVETSADLRHAKVFVSVLGGQREREETLAGLRSSHGYLQERVAEAVRLKRTPQLEFVYDGSVDRGMRINELLQRYESEVRTTDGEGEAAGERSAGDGAEEAG